MNYHGYTSSDSTLDFTDDEIKTELSRLGYENIGKEQFDEFKKDLAVLVNAERSRSITSDESSTCYHTAAEYYQQADDCYATTEKENKSSYRQAPMTFTRPVRAPLSAKSNTIHTESQFRSPHKTNPNYYVSNIHSPQSLPLHSAGRLPASAYYTAYEEMKLPEPGPPTGVDRIRHLDEYWHAKDIYDSNTADNYDRSLEDEFNSKLNLSRASQASLVKRKVSRRMEDGTSHVYEESYLKDDDSDAESCRSEPALPVSRPPETVGRSGVNTVRARQISARYDKSVDPVMSAVIWPEVKPVGSLRVQQKVDPVNRYQQYQQHWKRVKVPEEKLHKNLRWAVREQMLYKDIIYEKPQKKYVENKYVVPTDKKRKDLRWRIRADMAAGFMPSGY